MSRKKMQRELFEARKVQEYEEAMAARRAAQAAGSGEVPVPSMGRGVLSCIVKGEAEQDDVTGRAGLMLVVEALRAYHAEDVIRDLLQLKKRDRGYDEVAMIEALVLLQASGGEHLEDLLVLREDGGLERLLEREFPSPDAARDFLLRFHDPRLIEAARKRAEGQGEKSFVPEEAPALRALGQVHAVLLRRMADRTLGTCATLDHDATVIDSYKETATLHYKGATGYQPVVVHWAEQDLVVADEFRDGNVPAAKDNLPLILRAFASLPDWVTQRGFRADSACYDEKVLKWLANPQRKDGPQGTIEFTVSADMTTDLVAVCKRVAEPEAKVGQDQAHWKLLDDTRPHEIVEWAEVEFTPGVWPKDAWPLRYVAVRFTKRQGRLYASGERYKFLAVVTNRKETGDEVLHWHWKKAGTIEHVHEETKNGLGAGTLPCGEFGANAAWYRLAMLTYNVLTVIQRETLPPEQQRVKPKRLRFLVFNLVARLTVHARRLYAHIKHAALARTRFLLARLRFRGLARQRLAWVRSG